MGYLSLMVSLPLHKKILDKVLDKVDRIKSVFIVQCRLLAKEFTISQGYSILDPKGAEGKQK